MRIRQRDQEGDTVRIVVSHNTVVEMNDWFLQQTRYVDPARDLYRGQLKTARKMLQILGCSEGNCYRYKLEHYKHGRLVFSVAVISGIALLRVDKDNLFQWEQLWKEFMKKHNLKQLREEVYSFLSTL